MILDILPTNIIQNLLFIQFILISQFPLISLILPRCSSLYKDHNQPNQTLKDIPENNYDSTFMDIKSKLSLIISDYKTIKRLCQVIGLIKESQQDPKEKLLKINDLLYNLSTVNHNVLESHGEILSSLQRNILSVLGLEYDQLNRSEMKEIKQDLVEQDIGNVAKEPINIDEKENEEYRIYEVDINELDYEDNIPKSNMDNYGIKRVKYENVMEELKQVFGKQKKPTKIQLIKRGQKISLVEFPLDQEPLITPETPNINTEHKEDLDSLLNSNTDNIIHKDMLANSIDNCFGHTDFMQELLSLSIMKKSKDDNQNVIDYTDE